MSRRIRPRNFTSAISLLRLLVQISEHVRLLAAAVEPFSKLFDATRALLAHHPHQDGSARFRRELATDTPLPRVRQDRRDLVTEMKGFEQFPLAAIEPGVIAGTAHVDAVRDGARNLVLH